MKTSFAGNRPFPRQKRGRREFSWSQESHLSLLPTPAALGWIIPGKQTVLFIQEASQLSLENTVSAREAHVQKRLCNSSLIERTQEKNGALGENVFYGISRNIRILGREKDRDQLVDLYARFQGWPVGTGQHKGCALLWGRLFLQLAAFLSLLRSFRWLGRVYELNILLATSSLLLALYLFISYLGSHIGETLWV